jgi:hypothetical protein
VRAEAQGRRVLVSDGFPELVAERLRKAGYELAPACGGAIAVAPLIPGVRAGLRVAPRGRPISWQGRIGALISASGGARVEDERGEPFPEAVDAPARALLVSADDADAERLRHAVAALEEPPTA